MAAFLILLYLAGVVFSVRLIKQTSSDGIPPAARSARKKAIVLGFIPFYGLAIVGQLYFYSQYKGAIESEAQMEQAPRDFGVPKLRQQPTGSGEVPGQQQPKNNPFL